MSLVSSAVVSRSSPGVGHCPGTPLVWRATMRTQCATGLAVALLRGATAARADDRADAKALLDKAIKAMNGEAKLAKLSTGSLKGKITGKDGNREITLDIDATWQGMSQYRADVDIQDGGMNFKGVLVFDDANGC